MKRLLVFSEQEKRALIKAYSVKAERLDSLLGELTKDYCAYNCAPDDCCTEEKYYNCGGFPEFLALQKLEALKNGWSTKGKRASLDVSCLYRSENGCLLKSYKSSLCLGYLCDEINSHLIKAYGQKDAGNFFRAMDNFSLSNVLFDGWSQITMMGDAIWFAQRLVEKKGTFFK